MSATRQADGIRIFFAPFTNSGALAVGIDPDDIIVTGTAPDLATAIIVDAEETAAKPGQYTALVPSSFLIANGVGPYAVLVEIDSISPKVHAVRPYACRVTQNDIDDVAAQMKEVHALHGLDPANALVVTSTARQVGAGGAVVDQTVTEAPAGTVTVQRN
jgi:hypothetical protein